MKKTEQDIDSTNQEVYSSVHVNSKKTRRNPIVRATSFAVKTTVNTTAAIVIAGGLSSSVDPSERNGRIAPMVDAYFS